MLFPVTVQHWRIAKRRRALKTALATTRRAALLVTARIVGMAQARQAKDEHDITTAIPPCRMNVSKCFSYTKPASLVQGKTCSTGCNIFPALRCADGRLTSLKLMKLLYLTIPISFCLPKKGRLYCWKPKANSWTVATVNRKSAQDKHGKMPQTNLMTKGNINI